MIALLNDRHACVCQLSEMFQHLHDIDEGDVPPPSLTPAVLPPTAAFTPSIGPSSHTNPLMTLEFQMKALHASKVLPCLCLCAPLKLFDRPLFQQHVFVVSWRQSAFCPVAEC